MTGEHYSYEGMTALVDPDSFLDLVGSINAVDEQIIASSRIIINKIDLATPEELDTVREKIRKLNPSARVLETTYAKMDGFFDPAENPAPARPLFGLDTQAKQPLGRPGNFLVKTEKTLAKKQVEGFFRDVLPSIL